MKATRWLLALAAICLADPGRAGEAVPLFHINAKPEAAVELQLGPDIYRLSQRSNLSDLVLVDEQGNRLPFTIQPRQEITFTGTASTRVGFYPVTIESDTGQSRLDQGTTIILDQRQIRIEIDKQQARDPVAPTFYLLDIRDLKHPVTHLRIEWPEEEADHYRKMTIAGSQDLQQWTPLAEHALVRLHDKDQSLYQNRIPLKLSPGAWHYLKLSLVEKPEPLTIAGLYLEAEVEQMQQPSRDYWTIKGTPSRSQVSVVPRGQNLKAAAVAAWEFEREELLPISQISLNLGEKSYSGNIALYTRAKNSLDWQLVHRGLWFNTPVADRWKKSDDLSLSANSHRFWRLEMDESYRDQLQPELVLSYPAQVLRFIASPFAPYRVAVDPSNPNNYPQIQAQIFQQILGNHQPDWQSVEVSPLFAEDLRPAIRTSRPDWKITLFWITLITAVLLLTGFAWRLIRQMQ